MPFFERPLKYKSPNLTAKSVNHLKCKVNPCKVLGLLDQHSGNQDRRTTISNSYHGSNAKETLKPEKVE